MIGITTKENAVLVPVKVVPGASRTRYLGEWNGRAKLAVAAPPEKGKANKAIVAFFAERLAVRKGDVTVVMGHTSSVKTVKIDHVKANAVRAALQTGRS